MEDFNEKTNFANDLISSFLNSGVWVFPHELVGLLQYIS